MALKRYNLLAEWAIWRFFLVLHVFLLVSLYKQNKSIYKLDLFFCRSPLYSKPLKWYIWIEYLQKYSSNVLEKLDKFELVTAKRSIGKYISFISENILEFFVKISFVEQCSTRNDWNNLIFCWFCNFSPQHFRYNLY